MYIRSLAKNTQTRVMSSKTKDPNSRLKPSPNKKKTESFFRWKFPRRGTGGERSSNSSYNAPSVASSKAEVASSRTATWGRSSSKRQKAHRCFSPRLSTWINSPLPHGKLRWKHGFQTWDAGVGGCWILLQCQRIQSWTLGNQKMVHIHEDLTNEMTSQKLLHDSFSASAIVDLDRFRPVQSKAQFPNQLQHLEMIESGLKRLGALPVLQRPKLLDLKSAP